MVNGRNPQSENSVAENWLPPDQRHFQLPNIDLILDGNPELCLRAISRKSHVRFKWNAIMNWTWLRCRVPRDRPLSGDATRYFVCSTRIGSAVDGLEALRNRVTLSDEAIDCPSTLATDWNRDYFTSLENKCYKIVGWQCRMERKKKTTNVLNC